MSAASGPTWTATEVISRIYLRQRCASEHTASVELCTPLSGCVVYVAERGAIALDIPLAVFGTPICCPTAPLFQIDNNYRCFA